MEERHTYTTDHATVDSGSDAGSVDTGCVFDSGSTVLFMNCPTRQLNLDNHLQFGQHLLTDNSCTQQIQTDEHCETCDNTMSMVVTGNIQAEEFVELGEDGGLDCMQFVDDDTVPAVFYTCTMCQKTLTNAKSFHQHKRWHSLQYHCQECGRRFANPYNLRYHERTHSGERPHLCPECGQTFRIPGALSLHMRVHSNMRPYCCDHCDATFRRKGNLREHVLFKHEPDKLHSCGQCERKFVTTLKLHEHMHVHTGERPYQCTVCEKSFHSQLRLTSHRRRLHPQPATASVSRSIAQRQCTECGRVLSCKKSLIVHMRRHTGEHPFTCAQCEKAFASTAELAFHRLTHSTEKPFSCDICGNLFKRKKTLAKHCESQHDKVVRNVPCKFCSAVFRTEGAMYKHRRKHHQRAQQTTDFVVQGGTLAVVTEEVIESTVDVESQQPASRRWHNYRTAVRGSSVKSS